MAPLQIDPCPRKEGSTLRSCAGSCIALAKGWGVLVAALALLVSAEAVYSAEAQHGIAMHGEPALPADFTQLPYANPDAPKGGRFTRGVLGTFDSLNPLI